MRTIPTLMTALGVMFVMGLGLVAKPVRAEASKLAAGFYEPDWALKILQTFPIKFYQADAHEERLGPIPSELQKTHPEMVKTNATGHMEVFGVPNPWLIVKAIQELYTGQQQHEAAIQDLRGMKYGRPVRMPGLNALVSGPAASNTNANIMPVASVTPESKLPEAKPQDKKTIDALTRRIVFLEKIVRENNLKGMRPWPLPKKLPIKDVHHG